MMDAASAPSTSIARPRGGWRAIRLVALGALAAMLGLGAAAAIYVRSLGPLDVSIAARGSIIAVDRNGRLLRAFTTTDGRWRLPTTVADVDPKFFALLFAYEDRRFRDHHGVDPLAMARAALQRLLQALTRAYERAETRTHART